jgi:hypothetical protein
VGLSPARRRFTEFGPNEPVVWGRDSPFARFVPFCSNPLVLILLVASALPALVGNLVDPTLTAFKRRSELPSGLSFGARGRGA